MPVVPEVKLIVKMSVGLGTLYGIGFSFPILSTINEFSKAKVNLYPSSPQAKREKSREGEKRKGKKKGKVRKSFPEAKSVT